MPIFEYACRDCGRQFEAFVTASRTASCPGCSGENLSKLLSRPGMVGSGEQRTGPSMPAGGGCGAGGASCACRMNTH
jgi:putative FmdB family regulatory protein